MKITFLCTDDTHPVNAYLKQWKKKNDTFHDIDICRKKSALIGGDLLFLISCSEIVRREDREKYKESLVIHASDLPLGRGWSPHVWQVLEGKTRIKVTLLTAGEGVDTGDIWDQMDLHIPKHFLWDEINTALFEAEIKLIDRAVRCFDQKVSKPQSKDIEPTYYPKRTPQDSEIDPHDTLANQFDLIRVCDPHRFPAFFKLNGKTFKIRLEKDND